METRSVIVIGVIVWAVWVAPASSADATGASETASRARLSAGLSEINLQALEQLEAPRWGRDPFAQPTKEEVMAGTLSLTAILYHQSSAVAVLNGQVVRVGDEVDGRQVVAIDRDHVMVREGKVLRRLDVPRFTVQKRKP
ncbi:MAG: hypothetical protein HY208_04235 [Nitrospirae bacterium]|nr:hypothetical protein [Nitrospirota bacterium]